MKTLASTKTGPKIIHRLVLSILIILILSTCTSQTPASSQPSPTVTEVPEPTPSPSPKAMPTLASLPDGSLVYGDPEGRFSLPLTAGWTPVETDGSYGHFRLAELELEMYIVTIESDDLDAVAEASLVEIGLDPARLSQVSKVPMARWTGHVYTLESGEGVVLMVQPLEGASIAIIARGELSVITTPLEVLFHTPNGLAYMPLADYLEFKPPLAPNTIEDIEDVNYIEFYSGRTKLVGKLALPKGEGPFPAVVYVHGSAMSTRTERDFPALLAAGVAVFSYDKRGVGQSEGTYLGVSDASETDYSPSEWTLPKLAEDALAAVTFLQNLREINPKQIGLLGQSQAGSVIPQVVAQSDIPAFSVILIGQIVPVGEVYYYQQLTDAVQRMPQMTESEREELSAQLATFDGYPGFDPRPYIEAMEIPGLWIWGDRDGWVPPRKSRLELERIITEYDKDFTIIYDPDYGHDWPRSWTSQAVDWILAHLEE